MFCLPAVESNMHPLNAALMHPLLQRALVSAAASVVTTGVWVGTAERRQRPHEDDEGDNPGADGTNATARRAQLDVEPASHALRAEVFVDQVLSVPKNVMSRLRGKTDDGDDIIDADAEEVPVKVPKREQRRRRRPDDDDDHPQTGRQKGQKRRKKKSASERRRAAKRREQERDDGDDPVRKKKRRKKKRRKRKGEDQDWGIGASIRAEVKKQVKEAAVESIKDTYDAAADAIADTADVVKEKGAEVGAAIKGAIPEDVGGTLSDAADVFKESAGRLGTSVKGALPESTDDVARGLKGIGRFLQGPGAQNYDDSVADDKRLPPASFVSAQHDEEGKHAGVPETLAPDADAPSTPEVPSDMTAVADLMPPPSAEPAAAPPASAPAASRQESDTARAGRSIVERRMAALRAQAEQDGRRDDDDDA